jgi:hypothetical protein
LPIGTHRRPRVATCGTEPCLAQDPVEQAH